MDDKGPRLARGLYALIDDHLAAGRPMAALAAAAIFGGARVLQLRFKHTADRPALETIRAVVLGAAASGAQVIVNDRVDLALLGGAQGVHLGQDDVPIDVARRCLGPSALIGATVRTVADIEAAATLGADHVGLGPIFATQTKVLRDAPIGVPRFADLVAASRLPVVGISGVTLSNIAEVAAAGAWAAAVGSALLNTEDVAPAAAELSQRFSKGSLKARVG